MISLSKRVKQFGAKVKRNTELIGYTYVGKNFELNFHPEYGENGKVWVVNVYDQDVPKQVFEEFRWCDVMERKTDVVQMCFNLDRRMSL